MVAEGISIVLCTYNGERFLPQQLQSLLLQTRLPRELIVMDDASEDASFHLAESFAMAAPFPVVLKRNQKRLGVAQNFSTALSCVSGRMVALCDQDDVWHPEKLKRLSDACAVEGVVVAASDALLIDPKGHGLGATLWQRSHFTGRAREKFDGDPFKSLLRGNSISGATLMLDTDVLDYALPIPDGAIHDWWLLLLATMHGKIALVDEPLTAYRQHEHNVLGAPASTPLGQWREWQRRRRLPSWSESAMFRALLENPTVIPDHHLVDVQRKVALLDIRSNPGHTSLARLARVVCALARGDYRRYARGLRSAVADVMGPLIRPPAN